MNTAQIRPRILLLEHDRDLLDFLSRQLENRGADPCPCWTATRAVNLINQQKFDGVFLSATMPGMDGLQLVEKLRWSKSNSRCPIVLLTEQLDAHQLRPYFRAGVTFFLAKPVTEKQLHTILNATRGFMLQERRRYSRLPCRVPVQCEWTIQSVPQQASGMSVNLSASGMLVELSLTPPADAIVQTAFRLPRDPGTYNITCRLTRIGPDQQVGLAFTGLTESQRQGLMDFCSSVLCG